MLRSKFKDGLNQVFYNGMPSKVGVALSGGVDSMCLISLLDNYIKTNSISTEIYPITINHNLRNSSSLEIPIIRRNLENINIDTNKYLFKSIDIKSDTSFEEIARIERYKALKLLCKEHGIEDIFLAHHLDDQLETFVMRLFKNSGIFGLNSMNYKSKSVNNLNLIRPMLNIEKNEIYEYCITNEIEWVQDFTNFEEINKRNTIRKYLSNNVEVKNEIKNVFYKVRSLVSYIDAQIMKLSKEADITSSNSEIVIFLSNNQLETNSDLVISRFLFNSLYSFSPSFNYHYSFNKLLNSITKLYNDNKFTLLKLQWEITKTEDGINIKVKRENLRNAIITKINKDWILFDNRFWIKCELKGEHGIKTLMKDDKLNFLKVPKNFKYSKYANLPVLIDLKSGKIISIIENNDFLKIKLKDNIYNSTIVGNSSSSSTKP